MIFHAQGRRVVLSQSCATYNTAGCGVPPAFGCDVLTIYHAKYDEFQKAVMSMCVCRKNPAAVVHVMPVRKDVMYDRDGQILAEAVAHQAHPAVGQLEN